MKDKSTTKENKNTTKKRETLSLKKKEPVKVDDRFSTLIKADASKISPKSEGTIGFELVKDEKGILYLRLISNTSSGNFCKSPVALQSVIDVLAKQMADKAFNSRIMSDVFQGKGSKNSNNTSFLIAALRSKEIALIVADEKSPLSSRLSKAFKAKAEQLLAMS